MGQLADEMIYQQPDVLFRRTRESSLLRLLPKSPKSFSFNETCRRGEHRVLLFVLGTAAKRSSKRILKIPPTRRPFWRRARVLPHVWNLGIRRTPEPLGWDEENRLALFSFIEGAKLSQVDRRAVRQAAEFIVAINAPRASRLRRLQHRFGPLPKPVFSILEHLETVDKRVSRLANIEGGLPVDQQAREFVRTKLAPAWDQAREVIARTSGRAFRTPLPQECRCISPSDFGFQRILAPDGFLKFFDFEYAAGTTRRS